MSTLLYGFVNLKDVFSERVSSVGMDVVSSAIRATVQEHNRQMAAMMGLLVEPTTKYSRRFKTSASATLQPLDEDGRARPIKRKGYYDVAWPLQMSGAAWGQNYIAGAKMTVEEANNITDTLLSADFRWLRNHMLAALFANSSWTFSDDEHGDLTIKGPANGDTDTYAILNGADAPTTDDHFKAQSSSIDDDNDPFPAIETELLEHPENGGEVINFIPTALKSSVIALTDYLPIGDPNVARGISSDRLIGGLSNPVPGKVLGYLEDGGWIVEWRSLPDEHIISITTGGDRPLAMREDPEAELRGFQEIAQRDDHPFYESQWMRRAGFGAWNRVGAVITRIGNASYAVPTGYSSPMP